MNKSYYTYRIRVANVERVQVEKWDAQHKLLGEPSGVFRYKDNLEEINSLINTARNGEIKNSKQARLVGEVLFNTLFDDTLRQDFVNFHFQVVQQESQLLRVELDIDEQRMAEIAALPWEFMCLPGSANLGEIWISTHPNLVFSRRRAQWHPAPPIQLEQGEKLRIALAIAAPKDLGTVEYETVKSVLEDLAQEQSERIELLPIVNPATPNAIDALLEKQPHIFHFIGHGRLQDEDGEEVGQIALVKKVFNTASWIDAGGFAELLNRHRPGIVLLQACESGMSSASQAFVSVASKIVQQNIPVVVAMQYEVSNLTASQFAYEFYKRLAQDNPVDIAAQNARRTIALDTQHGKRDFATPVIFMRVHDGYLFKRKVVKDESQGNKVSSSSQQTAATGTTSQVGKDNVNIGEGKDIHIGDNCTLIQLLAKDSNFGNRSQESFKDLDFSSIPQESIQQAYQDALPPDAGVWNLEANNITQILQELEGFRRLFEFFNRLSQDEKVPQAIRNKLSIVAEEIASKKHPEENKDKYSTDFFSNKEGQHESYLIATIERCDDNQQFLLNAWLIIDDSVPGNDISKFISLLDRDEQQLETLCKFDDIEKQLNKFLKTSLRHLRGKQYQLIIEVFLPSDLIGTEVDRWKISDPIIEEITLGIKYPIRLRSLERLNLNYLDSYLSDWYKYWDRVKDVLHNEVVQESFAHLEEMENFNWKLLRNSLQDKIGLKVTCAPPKAKTKDLFNAILTATTPIAIWTRRDIHNCDQVREIDKILSFKPLCDLCESVRQARKEADAQTEEHLGFHLALLWENPHRLTPNVMLQLTTPGQ